jgi:anti-sigma B factor antagonist
MDQQPDGLSAEVIMDGVHAAIVRIVGEIDVATSPLITDAVHDAIGRGATRLVLDMSAVTFMDSSGIAALIATRSAAPVVVRSPSDAVVRLLATTGLTDTFTMDP